MTRATSLSPIRVLIADSNHLRGELLISAFRRHPEFKVTCCQPDIDGILNTLGHLPFDVVLLAGDPINHGGEEFVAVHHIHSQYPAVKQILLAEKIDRSAVLNAFRVGVSGIFTLSDRPFRWLCKCIQCVHRGEIWISNEQIQYLIDSMSRVQSLRVVNSLGLDLLTPREEQVVALVADGLSNREVATELNLSEHTVKKYLFRIFEKVGISSRVELILYAVNHGATREAEWIPAAD